MSINKTFGERVRERRQELGISQDELSRRIGYKSRSSINKIELGERDITQTKAIQIAKALGVPVDYLLDKKEEKGEPKPFKLTGIRNVIPLPEQVPVPRIGAIRCGKPVLATQEYDDYVMADKSLKADFCLTAVGDSMTGAFIRDGDTVFCRSCETVENGKIAAVEIDDEATLKRFYYYPTQGLVILKPCNPEYEDMLYSGEDASRVRVIGEAISFNSLVR